MATWINRKHLSGTEVYSIGIKFHKEKKYYFFRLKDTDVVDWEEYVKIRLALFSPDIELDWDMTRHFMESNNYIEIFLEDLE